MPNYTTYTKQELIEAQNQLSQETGENVSGVAGGLPVASQNQEFFAVFDEAGSTGPEIIDKTQFRLSYIVNSNLETSRPVINSPAAFNATQNFEKGKICQVRADNATVLNQNLTGDNFIYDIGTLQLISTTEYGKNNDEYITTMSFNSVGGQLVGSAQNISATLRGDGSDDNTLENDGDQKISLSTSLTPISQSAGTNEWVSWDGDEWEFVQSTLLAGTRLSAQLSFRLNVNDVYAGNEVVVQINIKRDPVGGSESIQTLGGQSFVSSVPAQPIAPQNFVYNSTVFFNFKDFSQGDKIYAEVIRSGGATQTDTEVSLVNLKFNFQQETPPGDGLIMGVNATTASYWEGVNNISGSGIASNDFNNAYSALTASSDFTNFSNGTYIQRLSTASDAFDPNSDGNTFNPIQQPLQFLTGDEIRFEYNPNKVHKVIRTETNSDSVSIVYITPAVNTETIAVEGSIGTQLNHFTHYRISQDGGYLIIDKQKENTAGVDQAFRGIITPQYPSEALLKKEDELIFELKKAGIIET